MKKQKTLQTCLQNSTAWQQVVSQIPLDLDTSAKEDKALLRRREVRSGGDLLRIVFAYTWCDWSLRIVASWATLLDLACLSDVAVLNRLRGSQVWLGKLVVACLKKRRVRLNQQAVRLRIVDASSISAPGSKATDWRMHLSIDLQRACIDGVEVTDATGGETLVRHPARPGDIIVADRGYPHPRGLGSVLKSGGQIVVRINWHNLPMQGAPGQPLSLIPWLRQVSATASTEREVWINTPDGTFKLRLMACPLPPQAAEAARRRCRQAAKKKGRTPSQESLFASGFVMVVTNLPAEQWDPEQVLSLYRIRWQVELLIKRLKSVLNLDHLRAQDPALAQVYLLGKLLAALMADELTQEIADRCPDLFESVDRPVSTWRLLILLSEGLYNAVRGEITLTLILERASTLKRYLCDAPRKRRQQLAQAQALLRTLNSS